MHVPLSICELPQLSIFFSSSLLHFALTAVEHRSELLKECHLYQDLNLDRAKMDTDQKQYGDLHGHPKIKQRIAITFLYAGLIASVTS